jgi:hypothetical protein
MKARIYAMAWHVLPYVCCVPLGAVLMSLVLQLFGSFK